MINPLNQLRLINKAIMRQFTAVSGDDAGVSSYIVAMRRTVRMEKQDKKDKIEPDRVKKELNGADDDTLIEPLDGLDLETPPADEKDPTEIEPSE